MASILQAVDDPRTDQNLRALEKKLGQAENAAAGTGELFLQLATAGDRKIAFGESSTTFPGGGTTSAIKEIAHGLGVAPVFAGAITLASEAATVPIVPRVVDGSFTKTAFKLRLYGAATISATTINFLWFAIG